MPIDASTDPYDSSSFDPAGAKVDRPDLAKEFGDEDAGHHERGDGVATSKVDPDQIDDDLGRAGTGASRAAAIDLDDVQKHAPDHLEPKADFGTAGQDDDLDRAGSGSGLKGALLAEASVGEHAAHGDAFHKFDDLHDSFDKGHEPKLDGLGDLHHDDGDALKGAVHAVDDHGLGDHDVDKFPDHHEGPDAHGAVDHHAADHHTDADHHGDKGDFLGLH